jgi:pullulanase
MIESVKHWINEYHIDAFRFDLMGCHDIETMNEIRKAVDAIDPTIFIYGEGWSAGQCALPTEQLATKANVSQLLGIAAFGDEMRDALRGPFDDDSKGAFLAAIPGSEESLKFGICGCIKHPQVNMSKVNYSTAAWAEEPIQAISYVSCHDDMCLTDRLRASIPSLSNSKGVESANDNMEELIRLDLLAQTAVFTSQGVPFMLCGEELLRTKQGVHNSFESPDSINQLNWDNTRHYPLVMNYYRDLISLRRNHPAFRLGTSEAVRRHLQFLDAPSCVVAFWLKGHAGGDSWGNIIVVLNANTTAQTVNIPQGTYTIVASNGVIYEHSTRQFTGQQVTVQPQSALILHD